MLLRLLLDKFRSILSYLYFIEQDLAEQGVLWKTLVIVTKFRFIYKGTGKVMGAKLKVFYKNKIIIYTNEYVTIILRYWKMLLIAKQNAIILYKDALQHFLGENALKMIIVHNFTANIFYYPILQIFYLMQC